MNITKIIVIPLIALLCCTTLAMSQTKAKNSAEAKALFQSGQTALKKGRPADAVVAFEKAYALSQHPALLVNIARVYAALNYLRKAIDYQRRYASAKPEKAKESIRKIAELRAKHASFPAVTVESQPSGQEVRIEDPYHPVLGKTPLRIKLPEGEHKILVGLGTAAIAKTIQFAQGTAPVVMFSSTPTQTPIKTPKVTAGPAKKTGLLTVNSPTHGVDIRIDGRLVGVTPLTNALTIAVGSHELSAVFQNVEYQKQNFTVRENATTDLLLTPPPDANISQLDWLETGFLSAGGAAIAAGVGAGILAMQAQQDLDDCRGSECRGTPRELTIANDLRSKAQLTDILLGCGAVLGSVGAYLWFADTDKPNESSQKTTEATGRIWGQAKQ